MMLRRLGVAISILGVITALGACRQETQPTPEETTLTAVGETAPAFVATTLSGDRFDLAAARGSVVVVSFFATWCPPCREEVPHLERLWQRLEGRDDCEMIALAREEGPDVLEPFVEKMGITYPVAPDPDREVYAHYADMYIPRTVVVDREGRIAYQSSSFDEAEFERVVAAVDEALGEGDGRRETGDAPPPDPGA
jgi:peroxiredoxin